MLHDYMQRSDNAIAYAQEGIITEANSAWLALFRVANEDDLIGMPLMDSFDSGTPGSRQRARSSRRSRANGRLLKSSRCAPSLTRAKCRSLS
ncbi:MAG: hypothetical protein U5K38_13575 [Woeseiaceae bacterium]|nr:hypothetical protein [Woeseiaceae bacterium]